MTPSQLKTPQVKITEAWINITWDVRLDLKTSGIIKIYLIHKTPKFSREKYVQIKLIGTQE